MPPVRFGTCELDLEAHQLWREGQPVHISPKAFELLKILVSERPRALSKTELHERIWPNTFVTDDSLARAVAEARAAIGDHAKTPTLLRTVHAFGYAFSGAVKEVEPTATAPLGEACGWLVVNGRAIALSPGEHIIGRDPAATILLDSIRVSRRHARIQAAESGVTIEDLGSRNGTWLRGERLSQPARLADGDEIALGGFVLKFRTAGDPAPTQPDE